MARPIRGLAITTRIATACGSGYQRGAGSFPQI